MPYMATEGYRGAERRLEAKQLHGLKCAAHRQNQANTLSRHDSVVRIS